MSLTNTLNLAHELTLEKTFTTYEPCPLLRILQSRLIDFSCCRSRSQRRVNGGERVPGVLHPIAASGLTFTWTFLLPEGES